MRNFRIDLNKVYNERVKPELTQREAEVMEAALAAPPLRALFTNVAGKVHWYLLNPPMPLNGKHFGVANSMEEAEEVTSRILGTAESNRAAMA